MKIISIDTETTALNPQDGILLSLGAVAWDFSAGELDLEKAPQIHLGIRLPKSASVTGHPVAIAMNSDLIVGLAQGNFEGILCDGYPNMFNKFIDFIYNQVGTGYSILGKNFDKLDRNFLVTSFPRFLENEEDLFNHRRYDLGNLFFDPSKHKNIPNSSTCFSLAGLSPEVEHTALADATKTLQAFNFLIKGFWYNEKK